MVFFAHVGINNGLSEILNKGFEWSIINIGAFTCTLSAATAHTFAGSVIITSGTSGRFISKASAVNTAITYIIP